MTAQQALSGGLAAVFALLVGLAALAGAIVLAVLSGAAFWPAYLVAVIGWSAVPIGALGILLTYHLVGGQWALVLGEALRGACRTLPLTALMFVPILMFTAELYPWAHPDGPPQPVSSAKAIYLSTPFFVGRTILYLTVWVVLAFALMFSGGPLQRHPRQRAVAAVGLILWSLSVTFAGVDWMMSLDPQYASSAYGWIYIADVLIAAFCFALLLAAAFGSARSHRPSSAGSVRGTDATGRFMAAATPSLGGFLLGGILAWAYLVFFQYLVSWSGNLPHAVEWYQQRSQGIWTWLIWTIALLHTALPFVVLISARARTSWRVLLTLAAVILIMRFVHTAWLILPTFPAGGGPGVVMILLMLLGIGGVWFGTFLWAMRPGEVSLPPAVEVR